MDALIDRFLYRLEVERGYSRNTVQAYAVDLRRFADHLQRRGHDLKTATEEDVRALLVAASRAELGPRSSARLLSAVRSFLRFAVEEGVLAHSPARSVKVPHLPRTMAKGVDGPSAWSRGTRTARGRSAQAAGRAVGRRANET